MFVLPFSKSVCTIQNPANVFIYYKIIVYYISAARYDGHHVILVSTENIKDPDIVPTDIEGHISKIDKTVQSRCVSRYDIKSDNVVVCLDIIV